MWVSATCNSIRINQWWYQRMSLTPRTLLRFPRPRGIRPLALGLAALVGLSLAQVQPSAPAAAESSRPAVQAQAKPAKGTALKSQAPKKDPSADKTMSRADTVVWPSAGTAELDAQTRDAALGNVGGLRVDVARAERGATGATRSAGQHPQRAKVQVFDRAAAKRAGVDGPMFRVSRADGVAAAEAVSVAVGYDSFAHAVGGDWGARLRLVQLPTCAVTTPDKPECRTATPVATINDTAARTLTADVTAAGVESGAMILAMSAGESSAQGDYTATKLSPSSSWSAATSTGGFNWTYPVRSPATPGGFGPQVALSYSSQSVDGRTSATNNQGSWIGEGFTYEPGYIERRYKACSDDGHETSGEQCWAFHNGTVMLSGHSGGLVKVDDSTYKLSSDDGSKVERITGGVNGDNDGEYWKITTVDGTQYFFGRNRLPGWTSGKEETESTWTVPVYGDDSGEPCYKSSGFDDSFCDQAWRWNLDYVIDPRGNVISYFYDREINYYARGGKTDVNGTAYDRGGYLARIDYGQRDQQVYTTNAPARVVFTTVERCIPGGSVDCDPQDLTEDTAASWPDVPQDRICAANTHCEFTQTSATYFTRKRLTKIQSEIRTGATWSPVESWGLEHQFKVNDDNSRTLWLAKITHSGHRGGTQTMPATELEGMQLPNRIDLDDDNFGPLIRYRLATIKTDAGAQITVNYKTPDCSKDNLPTPGNSTRRCYPVIWNPLGGGDEDKVTDWFHKYVLDNVVEDDLVGGNDDMVTSYEYVGGAAWRKGEPDGITKDEDLTWSDWRGYGQVIVRNGDGQSMPGRIDHFFLRGMSGGKKADGTRPTVVVADSTGTNHTDHDAYSGHELETIAYNGAEVLSKTVNRPWRQITHTQSESWGANVAGFVRTDLVRNLAAMPKDAQGNPVWHETQTATSYDPVWGRVDKVNDLGEVGQGKDGDDLCTRTWYVDNPGLHMYSYVSRTQTVSANCDVANPDLGKQLISDSRTSYDMQVWNAAPTKGSATRAEVLDRYDGTKILYIPGSETTDLDGYGRVKAVKDARGFTTSTEYTEVDGLTSQIKITNPRGHVTTTTLDPAFSAPTRIVDANLKKVDMVYDAFGGLTAVWKADRNRDQGAAPSMKFGYKVRNDKATVITTESINNDGTYRASYELFDGLLRPRQTQVPGPGGWLISDTFHDGRGKAWKANEAYLATGVAGDVPIVTPEGSVNGQTIIRYDAAGRAISETFAVAGDDRWTTTTAYEAFSTHVNPPAGGVPVTTVTNARGKVTEVRQYEGDSPSGPSDVTRYTYTPAGALETVTDPLNNVWRYEYDQRNLRVRVTDPDSGESRYTYDSAGNNTSVTDSRGIKLSNRYDELNRKTETWQGDLDTGTKLSAWSYDNTGSKGHLYYSQRIVSGQSYYTIFMTRDDLYRPTKTRYSFPSGGVGTLLGKSYDFTTGYNTDGTVQSAGTPAAGGLPAEAVATTYDSLLRPTTLTGTTSYVTATSYSSLGQLLQAELFTGGTGKKAWLTWDYERGTDRLQKTKVNRQGVTAVDMDAKYVYDAAGNVLSIEDAPTGGQRDVQCFVYDHLRRLTEAWSTANTTKTCNDGVAQTGVSGPAPYHHSWTFDKIGNRDTETIHSVTGGADTTRDYQYPTQGGGQNQPHTLTRVDENGPGGAKTYHYSYDRAGNTVCRPNATITNNCTVGSLAQHQDLAWDAEGHLQSSTPAGGQATTYVYDADGNRIVRKEPGGKTTLYLPGMELALNGTVVSGTRFYGFGTTVAVRTTTGVHFEAADHHGTATASIDASTGAITWRRSSPYGAIREPVVPSFWPDQRGFLGGTLDATTGLTHLGAREYDSATGRFVSLDPIMDLTDPSQWNGYAYANNTPVTLTDPEGLRPECGEGGARETCDNTAPMANGAGTWANNNTTHQVIDPFVFIPDPEKPISFPRYVELAGCPIMPSHCHVSDLSQEQALSFLGSYLCSYMQECDLQEELSRQSGLKFMEWMSYVPIVGVPYSIALAKEAWSQGNYGGAALEIAGILPVGKLKVLKGAGEVLDVAGDACKAVNSFDPETLVLMADGSKKKIKDVMIGDEVMATDPISGLTQARKVEYVHVNLDEQLTQLTVVDGSGVRSEVDTTWEHPFWSTSRAAWVNASELEPGEIVRGFGTETVEIVAADNRVGSKVMYNLTIDELHTYYVFAAETPVLVHNAGLGCLTVLRNWKSERFVFGNESFLLDKKGMEHILSRHHPNFWDGSVKAQQSFFDVKMSVGDVQDAIRSVMQQNRATLASKGSTGMYQIRGSVNGTNYVLGMNNGRVGQFYPTK
ncbi:RHS repeat-associated core domain-containing protein [Catellatospora sp. NPDC049111]|uniref:RHS repeat-associated core domain-containing protein n=1 Tax=Catellatospora sp. NPDC049111 TaxID=3155271 RepID=UPI0033CD09EA